MKYLLIVTFVFCLLGCETLNQLISDCNQTASTQYLLPVRLVHWDMIGERSLSDWVNHNIEYCPDHFRRNTPAGQAFGRAIEAVNDVVGSEVHFTNSPGMHRVGNQLIPSNHNSSIFDYIYSSDPLPSSGINPSPPWRFALLYYGHDVIADGVEHFTIFVDADDYRHSEDSNSDDYANIRGILHELGHAVGMDHVRKDNGDQIWHINDTRYISTMQGGLRYLSALDVGFLRRFYGSGASEHRNYVAGTKSRFQDGQGWYDTKSFYGKNPQSLYIDENNQLKDCTTDQNPIFYVSWFNTGTIDSEPNLCGMNRIYLRKVIDRRTSRGITLKQWKIAPMPHLSQDQWRGSVSLSPSDIQKLDLNAEYELVFHVNSTGVYNEITDKDNVVSYPIKIFQDNSDCLKFKPAPRRSRVNKDDGINHYPF